LIGGNSVVLSDGTFVSVFASEPMRGEMGVMDSMEFAGDTNNADLTKKCHLFALTSTTGGLSVTFPVQVSDCHRTENATNGHRTAGFPALAADAGSARFRDRLYVVWTDNRSGRHDVMLTTSRDKGNTWTAPQVINDDPVPADPTQGKDMMHANVAVNGAGIVGVSWAVRESVTDSGAWKIRFRASADGGETWSPSVQVTDDTRGVRPTVNAVRDKRLNPKRKRGEQEGPGISQSFLQTGGDTWAMVADGEGAFHPIWVDRRTGLFQVWTAAIRVRAR
jgi:hypothetical protein